MSSPRPVAFISKSVAPMGGLEADMLKCIRALAERGHKVHVLYGFKQHGTDDALQGADVSWHHIPMLKRPPVIGQIQLFYGIKRTLDRLKQQYPNLLTITLERLPFGDIHIGAAPQSVWIAARKRMGLSPFSQPVYRYWLSKMDKLVQQNSNHTLVIFSERDRQALMNVNVPDHRIARVIIPTDTKRFTPMNSENHRPYLTIIGSNPILKGIDRVLQAWVTIQHECPELKLRIVTKGWKVKKMMKKYSVERVEVVDFIPDVERYYHSSRLLLAPSMFETWGNVVPEALACGIPVITTEDVPSSELITSNTHGKVLHSHDDVSAMIQAIREILHQPLNLNDMHQRHNSVAEYMTKFQNLIEWLTQNAAQSQSGGSTH